MRRARPSSRLRRLSAAGGPQAPAAEVMRETLPNGLRVVVAPRPHLSHAYVTLAFGVGSRHESLGQNGVTHALEHMVFRGTAGFADVTALNREVEDFGGSLDGATYRDHVTFGTGCVPEALEDAVGILADLATTPRYRHLEVERAILREELLASVDARGRMVDMDNITHRAAFGRRDLGLPIEGSLENLARFSVSDLESHRRRAFTGRNGVLAVAGPVDPRVVVRAAKRWFRALPQGVRLGPGAPVWGALRPRLVHVRDEGSQAELRLSFPTCSPRHGAYPAMVMLSRALGDGLASRMHAELVDRLGLAYTLQAGLTTYEDGSLFELDVAVAPDRVLEVYRALDDFVARVGRMRFSTRELERVCRRHDYSLAVMNDQPGELAAWHAHNTLFGLEEVGQALPQRMRALEASDLRQIARDVLSLERRVLALMGRADRPVLTALGFPG